MKYNLVVALTTSFLFVVNAVIPVPAASTAEDSHTDAPVVVVQETVDYSTAPEGFRVTIIGSGSPLLNIHRGGQSIYVEYQDTSFLVDCGQWSTRTILDLGIDIEKITNMVFTHQHVDHNADFWSFSIGGWGTPTGRRELNLYGPGVRELYDATVDFFADDLRYRREIIGFPPEGMISNVNIYEFTNDIEILKVGEVTITAIPVPHTITAYAYKFEAGGRSVVISGDMTYDEKFPVFAEAADLLILDASMTDPFRNVPRMVAARVKANLSYSHILNEEIALVLRLAQPSTVVLTHILTDIDYESSKALYTMAGYSGEVIEAYDGLTITLPEK